MAITYHGGNIIRGTSTDRTGGTWTNLQAGYIFIESDTFAQYYWNGTAWNAIVSGAPNAAKITVYTDGSTWFAKNDRGSQLTSNASATTVLQYAFDNLTVGRTYKEQVKLIGLATITALTMPSYSILDLTGARIAQANATNTNMIKNADFSAGNTDIEILGGTIDGNRAGQTVTGANYDTRTTIRMEKVTNLLIHDTKLLNPLACGILAKDSENVWIDRNYITNAYQLGVYLWSPTLGTGKHAWVTNNRMYDLRENDVGVQGFSDVWVQNNDLELCGTVPINTQGTNLHILNNRIKTCARSGISLCSEGTHIGDFSEIVGNSVDNALTNDTTQTGLTDQAGAGIHAGVSEGAEWVQMRDNRVFAGTTQSNQAFGMRCEHSNYMQVLNNRIKGWNNSGLTIAGVNTAFPSTRIASQDRCIVMGNIVVDCGNINNASTAFRGGISLYGGGTDTDYLSNIIVRNNICYDNIDYGIRFKNCKNVWIEDNIVTGNSVGSILNAGSTAGVIRVRNNDGYVTENAGSSTQSGNATLKVFNIAHGLAAAPTSYNVDAGSADAIGPFYYSADATNLIVTYPTAPVTGTNNLVFRWSAEAFS